MLVIILLTIVHAAVLGLLWLGLRRPAAMAWIAGGYGALILAVVACQTGLMSGPTAASQLPPPSSMPSATNRQCREIVTLLTENRIILEEPRGNRLVVSRAAWTEFPEAVKDQIVTCVEQARLPEVQGNPLEVVER